MFKNQTYETLWKRIRINSTRLFLVSFLQTLLIHCMNRLVSIKVLQILNQIFVIKEKNFILTSRQNFVVCELNILGIFLGQVSNILLVSFAAMQKSSWCIHDPKFLIFCRLGSHYKYIDEIQERIQEKQACSADLIEAEPIKIYVASSKKAPQWNWVSISKFAWLVSNCSSLW